MRTECPKLESVQTDLSLNQLKINIMGHMKELFISMQEGLMQGIEITNAQRERQLKKVNQMEAINNKVYIAIPKNDEANLDVIMTEHNITNLFTKEDYRQKNYSLSQDEVTFVDYIIYQSDSINWDDRYKDIQDIISFVDEYPYQQGGRTMFVINESNEVDFNVGCYWDVFIVGEEIIVQTVKENWTK